MGKGLLELGRGGLIFNFHYYISSNLFVCFFLRKKKKNFNEIDIEDRRFPIECFKLKVISNIYNNTIIMDKRIHFIILYFIIYIKLHPFTLNIPYNIYDIYL